ncbi:MAG TPA: putative lipid II flippase FtsW [Candidatus Thiothrix moscowensis]|uniref:putative lipid II flippase FtsW n=1 Tax=unclassified Thiothrix TaxID=2636184 RepID=UPI0025E011E3|nr:MULTISPECIES: putative lipid II flippase FtsW [unclassified Thiothrix]HRJ51666.1 putative lipid II flippase FtsW [Candidatus Thiothrix moscowensis]HRJ91981.1 putative lipid II flippase FtsW [Candidatus Thiothrix moscowensis]
MNAAAIQPDMPETGLWARYIDRDLLVALLALLAIGVVMLLSASMWVAERQYSNPYYYFVRQLVFLGLGLVLALLMYQIRLDFWQKLGVRLLPIVLVLLVLVLIPGIGKTVNGSSRWLNLGFMSVQVSEIAKLIMLLYLSGYLIRHGKNLATSPSYQPLLIPLTVLGVTGGLLLLEPDFGSTVVIFATGLALLFLGGVPMKRLGILLGGAVLVMIPVSMMGYRSARWDALMNPWAHEADKGYQTVHALMAIGDGGWFGNGLGGSVQKLFYLPEAHNDFIFSILAEEFGFIGMLLVLSLYGWLVMRAFVIGFQADKAGKHYGAYVAYGVGFWMGFQVILHIGVNLAVLPPKGLTLPLMSYGGSSLMITLAAMALLMRVHRETQTVLLGLPERKPRQVRRVTHG